MRVSQKVIGIIGGGQLGKLIAISAAKLGHTTHVLTDIQDHCSFANVITVADFSHHQSLEFFAKNIDVFTIESENIPCDVIDYISYYKAFYPGKKALYISQNRIREKDFFRTLNLQTTDYACIQDYDSLLEKSQIFGYPLILKTAEMGYDGYGQYLIQNDNSIIDFVEFQWNTQYILEVCVDFVKELSIVLGRDENGRVSFFPIAENDHINGILNTSRAPAQIDHTIIQAVQYQAQKIANALEIIGLLAVEFFLTQDNKLLVNEIAPRPHNSCHWSLDACNISQFEQMIRIMCGLPMQEVELHYPCMTKNIIGSMPILKYFSNQHASITLYGKREIRDKRKMGHINFNLLTS
ncbi:5-(carboxyamino)imidazole ribonucleotide synthase [Wolbachia endosymbiont of Howardula sp.]|uniref:5-(carboxyamino)imidazole ribonucleotide synthase n=1 Tax=Wolbachia endosymbiont of Howardula sp. TaxID=2916816 RepID=UPI00217EEEAF|nr:5-(carboxyamino)imidazole ribonucleotide synthase [Wolbachia endosymbiont of Howardula sp.]UWI83351.1 5-(carboxyamino)imidazole ribonucleotide synthase [Wolbachia endosymbiont of Howardula sp.]